MDILENISIIIPIAPSDDAWKELVSDLEYLPKKTEIIFASHKRPKSLPQNLPANTFWVKSEGDRAGGLNTGANHASREYLWFLHADSRFDETTLPSLNASIKRHPDNLHYFNISWYGEALKKMKFNEIGVKFRSHILKSPFGDQGFCIKKDIFIKLGGFTEGLQYGEDHIFVWQARCANIKLRCTGGTLLTSARKYDGAGWLNVTSKHLYLWIKQAVPQWLKYMKIRMDK